MSKGSEDEGEGGLTWDCEARGGVFLWDDEAYSYGEAILCFVCRDEAEG